MQILVKPSVSKIEQFLAELSPHDNTSEFIGGRAYRKRIAQGSAIHLQAQLWDAINATVPNRQQAIAYPNHRCSFGGWSIIADLAVFLDPELPSTTPLPHSQSLSPTPNAFSLAAHKSQNAHRSPDANKTYFHSSLSPIYTCTRYPDWMIEILLPEQDSIHTIRTVVHCLSQGTQMVWLIDLNNHLTFVFAPNQNPLEVAGQSLLPTPPAIKALSLTVDQLFSWIPTTPGLF